MVALNRATLQLFIIQESIKFRNARPKNLFVRQDGPSSH